MMVILCSLRANCDLLRICSTEEAALTYLQAQGFARTVVKSGFGFFFLLHIPNRPTSTSTHIEYQEYHEL